MVMPGLDATLDDDSPHLVAAYTARTLRRTVPPSIPGIHFLSGGMGAEETTRNLQLLQREYPEAPWIMSFSFGRALQDAPLKEWGGKPERVALAQQLLLDLARVNAEASTGEWNEVHPTPASGSISAGRILLPKLSYSSERKTPTAELFNW